MGCDLFFEIPVGGCAENYVYNVVSAPMTIKVTASFTASCQVVCDWNGILGANLGQGWRLVEIFIDQAQQTTQVTGFKWWVKYITQQLILILQ